MKKLFIWLFGAFKPDRSKYVGNIQQNQNSNDSGGYSQPIVRKAGTPVLAWIKTKDIVKNTENNQGVTIDLELAQDAGFSVIPKSEETRVSSKKKGLSHVAHRVEIPLSAGAHDLIESASKETPISFIYRGRKGECTILGESKGLVQDTQAEDNLVFNGHENDVFYKISEECFSKLLPNIE